MSQQRCSNCSALLSPEDQFCSDCGQPVSGMAAEPRREVPPPPPPPQPAREEARPPVPAATAPPPSPSPVQPETPVVPQAAPPPPQSYTPAAPAADIPQETSKKRGGLKIGLIGIIVIAMAIICLVGGVLVAKALLGGDGTAPVLVENDSSVEICYVLISPSSSEEWGEDWLGSNDTIPPGSDYTFRVASNQSIDMQLYNCDKVLLDEQRNVMLDDKGITYTLEDLQ